MSSSAVTASGPSWQVDIPGLSQLILNVGSHGLKQLAMAGVDIHSIGCMLMIAEYTPASQEFRKKITATREMQRSERLWFYKAVEFGAGTNFLADQLLKTRAGENVLALMAAMAPVMDERTCLTALTAMFEDAKVSLDNIPGLNQFKAIRTALVPLARKVGLSEKILKYHLFLCSLAGSQRSDAYFAIPEAKDIASIIRMLHKLASNEGPYIFASQGLRGAAWILSYTSDVLGLSVCAIRADGTPIPITGSYEDAKILLEVDSPLSTFSLYLEKDLHEQFEFLEWDLESRKGWSIDCTQVNVLDYCHPGAASSESLERISSFTALETLNYVSVLATKMPRRSSAVKLSDGYWGNNQFTSFAESELPAIQARSLKILWCLGFRPGSMDQYKFEADRQCPTYIARKHVRDTEVLITGKRYGKDQPPLNTSFPDTALETDRVHDYMCMSDKYESERPSKDTKSSYQSNYLDWLPHMQENMTRMMDRAIYFAAHAAFSDWDTSFRLICVEFLNFVPVYEAMFWESSTKCFEAYMEEAISLCIDAIDISEIETRLWTEDWLALDLDGVILHRYVGSRKSIHDIKGIFFGFVPGRILCDGNYCSRIRSDRISITPTPTKLSELLPTKPFQCGPETMYPDLSIRNMLHNVQDTLYVRTEAQLESDRILSGFDISLVSRNLPDISVSVSCQHGYGERTVNPSAYQKQLAQTMRSQPHFTLNSTIIIPELLLSAPTSFQRSFKRLIIQYQQVDNSPVGQWLACNWKYPDNRSVIIIQKNCCFGCILNRILSWAGGYESEVRNRHIKGLYACVIAGGVEDPATSPQAGI